MTVFQVLRRYARRSSEVRCELCALTVAAAHPHVVDLASRTVRCACPACAVLFRHAQRGRYRTIPDRVLRDDQLDLTEQTWQEIGVPVRLLFVLFDSTLDRHLAQVPSPGGPVEIELTTNALLALGRRVRLLAHLEPDVEAILVHGPRGGERLDCLLVPIDACYDLVTAVRRRWRGFDGGDAVRIEIERRLADLRARSSPCPSQAGHTTSGRNP
jgi:hypothetical protein